MIWVEQSVWILNQFPDLGKILGAVLFRAEPFQGALDF